MQPRLIKISLLLALALAAAQCAYAANPPASAPASAPVPMASDDDYGDDAYAVPVVHVSDPLEPVNRVVFKFNDEAYHYVLKPVSKGYVRVVPGTIREGLGNFFTNLAFPIRFVNEVLQGKFKRAGLESKKFYVNTIGGLGGFIRISDDVPSLASLPSTDMGITFGVWGIHQGPYLVIPLLGPSSVRDGVGLVGDYFLNPLDWNQLRYVHHYHWWWTTTVLVTAEVQGLPGAMQLYDSQKKAALDPYIAVRTAYSQYRAAAVKK